MKGKALRKHNLLLNTAASVLLKLFNSGNERCHTTDTEDYICFYVIREGYLSIDSYFRAHIAYKRTYGGLRIP